MEQLKCERNGCKKKFMESENGPEACNYHSGKPLFHDLKKGWTCCNIIVYDWDEFQKIPTCAVGEHSTVKDNGVNQGQFFQNNRDQQQDIAQDKPVLLKIDDFEKKMAIEKEEAKKNEKPKTIFISPKGFYKCVNKGCLKEYDPNNEGECNYHKGGPVFHDCVKFWSCCKTETWDWDDFMKLPTCTVGKHEPKYV